MYHNLKCRVYPSKTKKNPFLENPQAYISQIDSRLCQQKLWPVLSVWLEGDDEAIRGRRWVQASFYSYSLHSINVDPAENDSHHWSRRVVTSLRSMAITSPLSFCLVSMSTVKGRLTLSPWLQWRDRRRQMHPTYLYTYRIISVLYWRLGCSSQGVL